MSKVVRPMNLFVECKCGIKYISGYTHCPNCGLSNPMDNRNN